MTRRTLNLIMIAVGVFYLLLVVVFFQLDVEGETIQQLRYALPLLVAIPAAGLVEAFRRRSAFQEAVTELYYAVVDDLQTAILYTKKVKPTEEEYFETLSRLSRSIDRIRAHFENIPRPKTGEFLYPFEGVKTFFQWIEYLGGGDQWKGQSAAEQTRAAIIDLWKYKVRDPMLRELDRHRPTEFMSPYAGDEMWRLPPETYLRTEAVGPRSAKVERPNA